jgi:carbon-monoxide dehydrogenase medium subunit
LAGGQSLVPLLNLRLARPDLVVSIRGVDELKEISERDGVLRVGAGVTQTAGERSGLVQSTAPLLHEAIRNIAHPQIRNRGTICGSLAHHDPFAELPAAAVALGARLLVKSWRGERVVEAHDFFTFPYSTDLQSDEMLTEVQIPVATPNEGFAFVEARRRRGDFASVAVAVRVRRGAAGLVEDAAVVLVGVAGRPHRSQAAHELVVATDLNERVAALAAAAVADEINPADDIHLSGASRRGIAASLVESALTEAWRRVPSGTAN